MGTFKRFLVEDEGAEITEVALVVAVVAVAFLTGATPLGNALKGAYNKISSRVSTESSAL